MNILSCVLSDWQGELKHPKCDNYNPKGEEKRGGNSKALRKTVSKKWTCCPPLWNEFVPFSNNCQSLDKNRSFVRAHLETESVQPLFQIRLNQISHICSPTFRAPKLLLPSAAQVVSSRTNSNPSVNWCLHNFFFYLLVHSPADWTSEAKRQIWRSDGFYFTSCSTRLDQS